ncbi:MAG: hypothetical protein IJG13_02220, partial [Kiritimatiellae bacterium]|nr:hypothetical protein [Kiritimatiellia bacterium]
PAAGGVAPDVPLSRGVTSVSFKSRDEAICDEARAAFEESLGDLDPFSFPEGSTNTVLEHLFYSGTTNGAFAYPQPTEHTAVLRVSVSGTGTGDLLVGGSYVPLVAPPQMRGGQQANPLLSPVPDGGRVPVYLKGDGTLSVSFDSSEFAFGELPSLSANRCAGWINFPETRATEPCVHDFRTRRKQVSLPASPGADDLSCTWQGGGDVQVEDVPPRSARITASFGARETREITYTLSHPKRLFGQTQYSQTVRFCPRPPDPDPADPDPPEDPSWFSEGDPPEDDDIEYLDENGPEQPGGAPAAGDEDEVCTVHEVPYEQCASLHAADYTNAVQNVTHMSGVLYVRDPPVVGDQISLEVPDEHVNCCGCPDHWTNCVSLAYRSHRLRVTGPGGQDFSSTGSSCTVDVAGVRPSRSVGDAGLAFARNGEIYERRDYTVFGVGIRRDGIPLSRYNALNAQFGFPMTVCTNDWRAPTLNLVTDVRLPSGTVHIEFAGATAPFALWYMRRGESEYRKLLDTETCPAKDIPIAAWRSVVAGVAEDSAASVPVLVTSPSPGAVSLVLRYWNIVNGVFVEDSASQRITSVKPVLLADYNRDRVLDAVDIARHIAGRYVYFWMNDDKWKGDNAFETFLSRNSGNDVIDGRNDLINFLPIAVDVAPFASHWNQGDVYYRLEADSSALRNAKLAFADVEWSQIGDAPLGNDMDIDGNAVHEAPVFALGGGTNLPPAFASLSQSERSTLLMEFPEAARFHDLHLNVYSKSDDAILFSASLHLHVGEVSKMIGWENLRDAAGGSGGMPTRLATDDWPAEEHEPGNVVFVHGYNMEEDVETPLWAQNVFKKLWWAGLDRGFIAVQWNGDRGQVFGTLTPNYYGNVQNAFQTASALAGAMQSVQGPKWFIAHSLGNMLVSAAIQDYGMPHEKYFMLNAAIAMEALDPTNGITQESHDNMTPHAWTNYVDRVRSTHWFERFPEGDGRRLLTWKGRFANVTNIVNFYSTQEEVVNNGDGDWHTILKRNFVWYNQETRKGVWPLMLHEYEGGWEFNPYHDTVTGSHVGNEYVESRQKMSPQNAANLTDEQLQEHPFFLDFVNPEMHSSSNGLIVATNYLYRAEMLAYAIPAESFTAGANPLPGRDDVSYIDRDKPMFGSYNMAILFDAGIEDLPQNGNDPEDRHQDWQHSTFVQRSYKRVHQLFKKITQLMKESQK